MSPGYASDIATIAGIRAVPTILEVVCDATGMGFAAVARVTEDRWIACAVRDSIAFGVQPGGELPIETTICHEVRQKREIVVINNVAEDVAYRGHHAPAQYGFQSYISVPIILPDDSFFGTLCAIDPRPAQLNDPKTIGLFKLFAELIGFHLNTNAQLASSEASLLDERRTAELREQFIAVLGHDLRNPLSAVKAAAQLLRRGSLDEKASRLVSLIQTSADRMADLIENVMDFARGRLGSGLPLERTAEPLAPLLRQVVAELGASFPDRVIETEFACEGAIVCDQTRIGQLLSNLLGNALTHGVPDQPIRVRAGIAAMTFELSVSNAGNPIPTVAMERLFHPFSRGDVRPSQQGLGLGLFISAEIAKAHHGTLDVTSSPEETRFTFHMPLAHAVSQELAVPQEPALSQGTSLRQTVCLPDGADD